MPDIKVVSVNENEEVKQEEAPEITEEVEQTPEEVEVTKAEEVKQEQPKEEVISEPLKNNSKTEKLKDKMVTCPKCGKTMQLRNYRYKHEKTCSGAIENKPIKPKAKPKAKAEPIKEEEEEVPRELPPWKQKPTMNEVLENSTRPVTAVNPLNSLANHYQLLQQECIKQKQEKYNSLCKGMFSAKPKKR